jgi:uncharacterized protein YeaO (DUF488 family)
VPQIKIKRVYDPASEHDGYRVLVDRIWPRGKSKEALRVDLWLKDVAPSNGLRKWFGHDPAKWDHFKEKYMAELKTNDAYTKLLKIVREKGDVTLLYSAKDTEHNQAVVLKIMLEESLK